MLNRDGLKDNSYEDVVHEEPPKKCADKIPFDSKKIAQASATIAGDKYRSRLGVYKCSHCGLWHIKTIYE